MPLSPLFKDREHFLLDPELSMAEKMANYERQTNDYISPKVVTQDVSFMSGPRRVHGRWYRSPKAIGAKPLLIWFHGGGYEMGNFNMNESHIVALELADRGLINIFNFDYTLAANGVKFPVPQEDGLASLNYVFANLDPSEVDASKVFIGGISAGGALAACVATMDRDQGNTRIAGQLLNCPILHSVIPEPSHEASEDFKQWSFLIDNNEVGPLLTRLGSNVPEAQPWWWAGEIGDFTGMPATQIINCQYDGIRPSGEKYGEQLKLAGIDVEVLLQLGVPHAHINRIPDDCPEMVETLNSMIEWISRH